MKKFTKTLSMVLLIAMCMSMFAGNAFAVDEHKCADHASGGHVKKVEAVAHTCTEDGNIEYYICNFDGCSKCYRDAALTDYISNPADLVDPAAHNKQLITGSAATCTASGMSNGYWCSECGLWWDEAGNEITDRTIAALGHDYGEWTVKTEATMKADGEEVRTCTRTGCGVQDTRVIPKLTAPPFSVSGTTPAAFEKSKTFTYYVDLPSVYQIDKITIGGTNFYEGEAYSYNNDTGKIVIYGGEIAGIMSGKTSAEVVFHSGDHSCGGFTLNNATTTSGVKVDGFPQKGFTQGSTEAVTLGTNDPNPANVKLYSVKDQVYVTITDKDYTFTALGGGEYTYTFKSSLLDTLEPGTYYARCFYGDGKYEYAGTIVISKDGTTAGLSSSLIFSNSTVSEKEFKYVSGKDAPRLYCELFRVTNKLMISTDGYSWKNVNVHDFYIEQSNGKATPYAWIKTSYLDSLPASSNIYLKVVVPASERGASVDAESNQIKIVTGHTLAAVDTNKHVINSSKNLRFVCSDVISEVYVGGQNLAKTDPDAFKVSADGKYVTLYADFLNDRTAGSTYTLSVLTESGEKLSTTFQILTTAQASASPRTGDDSNIALWSAFLLMSGAAVVAVLPRLKKEN